MSAAALDYRFGWLWLLPFAPGAGTVIAGFDEEETGFLQRRFFELQDTGESADGWVIDADRADPARFQGQSAPAWMVVVGKGRKVAWWQAHFTVAYDRVRQYGLLPAASPRLVVPLHRARHTLLALQLHGPGRPLARIGIAVAAAARRAGTSLPLRGHVMLVATRAGEARPTAGRMLPAAIDDFALYLGTPDERRKTVVLPLGEQHPTAILKTATTTAARRALTGEAATLRDLATTSLAGCVPRVITFSDEPDAMTLQLEYRQRRASPRAAFDDAARDFLVQLSGRNRRPRLLAEALAEVCPVDMQPAVPRVYAWLQRLGADGMVLTEHCGHGDLAPWNCSWTDRGFFVYDWEDSTDHAAAFTDAFYFRLASYCHISARRGAAAALDAALALAADLAARGAGDPATIRPTLAYWLLQRLHTLPRAPTLLAEFAEHLM